MTPRKFRARRTGSSFFLSVIASLILAGSLLSCSQQGRREVEEQVSEQKVPPKFVYNIYGSEGSVSDTLDGPLGIAVSKGKVVVVNSGRGEVWIFDLEGGLLSSFPTWLIQGSTEPIKESPDKPYPVGITVVDDKDIYVSDIRSKRVMVYGLDGKFLRLFPHSDRRESLLDKPVALAYSKNRLYVTDVGDQSVKIFAKEGDLLKKFGQAGRSDGQFSFPNGLAVSDDGTIFVADSNNSRVQAFDLEGKFLFSITGAPGEKLRLPRSIALDGLGRLHVADTLSQKIYVFNEKGRFLFSYGKSRGEGGMSGREGIAENELDLPVGIAVDKETRRVYITDKGNNRVSVWEY